MREADDRLALDARHLIQRLESALIRLEAGNPLSPDVSVTQRRARPPLPDPRMIRWIIRQRRLRDRYFESDLFADPGWDILLELAASRAEHHRVSISDLTLAAAVPATTALRWITMMTERRLLVRVPDDQDKRRTYITLAEPVAEAIARYFDELGRDAGRVI